MSTLENLLNEQVTALKTQVHQQNQLIQEYKHSTDAVLEQNRLLHQINNALEARLNKIQSQTLPEETLTLFKEQVEAQLQDINLIDHLVKRSIQMNMNSKLAYIEQMITSLTQTNDTQPLEKMLKKHSEAIQNLSDSQTNLTNILNKLENSYKA